MSTNEQELSHKVGMMAKIGACWSPSFSPAGDTIAFISNLSGVPQVWIVSTTGGWPQRVTALDDQVVSVAWSPDGQWLAFQLAPGGGLNSQIYIVRPDGTDLRRLTDGGQENNWLGHWTHDGKAITFSSSKRGPDVMDIWIVDVESGEQRQIVEGSGISVVMDISPDNRQMIVSRLINRGDNSLYLVDVASGDEVLLTPHSDPSNFNNGRFTPDGSRIYLTSNRDSEMFTLGRLNPYTDSGPGPIEIIVQRDDADLSAFEITNDGKTAALLWNIAGKYELVFLDLQTLALSPGPSLPAEIAYNLSVSKDGRFWGMVLSGSAHPMDVWVLENASGEIQQVTHSPHAGVDLSSLINPELVQLKAHDGLSISGWLYRPVGFDEPGAVVFSFHGGPEAQEIPRFNSTYQALLSEGIAIFAPNVRGSAGFGKTFINLDNGALRVNAVKDIEACVNHLVSEGIAAPGRLGIMGGSYGGYMTMAGITEFPDMFAAAANLFGIVNFKTFFEHTEPWMASISKIEYGDPDTEEEMLNNLSPIFKLDRVKAATLVLHGANDTNVPVIEAEQVVDYLKMNDVPVELVLFPDEGHGFLKENNRITATLSIVRWFKTHLRVD